MKRPWLLLLALLACLLLPGPAAARPMRVAFIDGFNPGEWEDKYMTAMRAAAEDLGVALSVHDAGHWPAETLARVRRLLEGPERPDYLVVTVHRAMGARLLELAEQARVPVFVVNSGLLEQEQARYGGPREYFHWWIGQMLPDDEQAGYAVANALIDQALRRKRVGADGRVQLIALGGVPVDQPSIEREQGLRRAVAERGDVTLLQLVPADWTAAQAERKTRLLLQRYPQATALWAASDTMALGGVRSLRALGLRPGTDVLVGSFNWEPRALEAVRRGELVATAGAHFLEGAWTLVLLHDYHHGLDFAQERVDWRSRMHLVTRENLDACVAFLDSPEQWKHIDFRSFSRAHNPGLRHYPFTFEALSRRLAHHAARARRP